jgi:hypothetical protein
MTYIKKKTKSVTIKPAPSTVAILEANEEDTDLLPPDTVRSEVNFLNYPLFALRDNDVHARTEITYKDVVNRNGQSVEIEWTVSANPKHGYPATFDSKVFKAIEQIISEMKPPIQNPVRIGSLNRLAKLMGLRVSKKGQVSGKAYQMIQDSLNRMFETTIHSRGTFYDKGEEKFADVRLHLVEKVVSVGKKLRSGEVADSNYVYLDDIFLGSRNSNYTKPLDYTYYRTLQSPIARRLYELLGVKFKGSLFINYRYSKLCQLLPLTQQSYASYAKRILEPAHQELIRTGFFEKVEWQPIKDEPHDWLVNYWAGERAKREIQQAIEEGKRGNNHMALLPPDVLELGQSTPTRTLQRTEEDNDVVIALQNFGISKKTAERLAKNHPEQDVFEKLQLVQWLVDTKSPLVSKNPQGFLVKALDEGYLPQPPKGYKTATQRKEEAERQNLELEQQRQVTEQFQKAREEAKQRLIKKYPPQPIVGTEHTTQSAWSKALASLKEQVPPATYATWLKDTLLLQVTDTAARIRVPNRYAIAWLEHRMYQEISNAVKGVLGKDLDLEFVVANPE